MFYSLSSFLALLKYQKGKSVQDEEPLDPNTGVNKRRMDRHPLSIISEALWAKSKRIRKEAGVFVSASFFF